MYDLFNPAPESGPIVEPEGNKPNGSGQFGIPGLKYLPNYISVVQENFLTGQVNRAVWLGDLKRRVQHYGYKYDYRARSIDQSMFIGELPIWIQSLAIRLFSEGHISKVPDQVIINEYLAGQGITNHVDCQPCFGETIISLSLGSCCIMDLVHVKTGRRVDILLEPRSIIVLNGEARYLWSHGIPARKTDWYQGFKYSRTTRLSMTFRYVTNH